MTKVAKIERKKIPVKKVKSATPKVSIEEALVQVVKLFLVQAPYKLTYSKISRATKIPRSTLYYYFGSKVESMLTEAVRFALKLFLQLNTLDEDIKKNSSWHDFQKHRLLSAMQQVESAPWAPRVYMLFREDSGAIGKAAREIEAEYLKQMAKAWRYYHPKDEFNDNIQLVANALKMGLLWGLSVQQRCAGPNRGRISDSNLVAEELTKLMSKVLKS